MKKLNAALMKLLRVFLSAFGKGIITLVPILIIFWLLGLFLGDGMITMRDIIFSILRRLFPEVKEWMIGLGLILTILFLGLITSSVFKQIYACIGELIQKSLRRKINEGSGIVVNERYGIALFEYFRKNIWVLGVVVGYIKGSEKLKGGKILKIFIPSVPVVLTGMAPIFIQEKNVIFIKMSLDVLLNTFISGGLLFPKKLPELVKKLKQKELNK